MSLMHHHEIDQPDHYDVVILGGGVAGCASALALNNINPALKLAIVERQVRPDVSDIDAGNSRIGETLPAQAVVPLQQLGLWQSFKECDFMPAYGSSALWGSDQIYYNEFMLSPYGHGWHLNRLAFDRWFVSQAIERGVNYIEDRQLLRCQQHEQQYLLEFKNSKPLKTNFVIDATGRQSRFAHYQGAKTIVEDRLLAIYRFYQVDYINDQMDTNTLVESHANGWWYSAYLPGQQLLVALMTDADLARQNRYRHCSDWEDCLSLSTLTRQRVLHSIDHGVNPDRSGYQLKVIAAQGQSLDTLAGCGWLAVGDAAYNFDPLSSLGLFNAMRMGLYASFAITDYFNGIDVELKKYQLVARSEYQTYLKKRQDYYAQEQRFVDAPFWKRRHSEKSVLHSELGVGVLS